MFCSENQSGRINNILIFALVTTSNCSLNSIIHHNPLNINCGERYRYNYNYNDIIEHYTEQLLLSLGLVGLPLLKLKLIYDRQSIGQSVLVSGAHLGPLKTLPFSLKFPLDSRGFAIL
jgi:hypothetical protein